MNFEVRRFFISLTILILFGSMLLVSSEAIAPDDKGQFSASVPSSNTVLLEDFSDIVTETDLGFNDFSGNMGAINGNYVNEMTVLCPEDPSLCALRFEWDFKDEREVFTGIFFSLFGLTDTKATFDGETIEAVAFPEHSLDFTDIDGDLIDPVGPRQVTDVCFEVTYQGDQPLWLRIELQDTQRRSIFTRFFVTGSSSPQQHCWDQHLLQQSAARALSFDLHHVKVLTLIIEREHVGDGITNPAQHDFDLHRLWLVLDRSETQPQDDQALLDLMERRAYQYFLDWSSRKSVSPYVSYGIPQDRSTFGDLLTVGGIGFALPAHVIGTEQGWTARADAAARVVSVLRILDDPDAFGPEPVGRIGHQGWFYHFLGINGRRRLNFDFPETENKDESLNTVELSTIDTGLAIMGILAAQSYFDDPADPLEIEIRQRAQSIYDRVNWPFMLEQTSRQFFLGWKPNEERDLEPAFEIPDADGMGSYSGIPNDPATLDYYTDEALIVILLGMGSETYPIPPEILDALIAEPDGQGLIRTYPGSLFTYQFLHAFLDTRTFPDCGGIDWHQNSRLVMQSVITYAEENPNGYLSYGPTAWGISAAEGPLDAYHAYGAPPVAIADPPEEDGTVTYYAMLSAASFGEDLRQRSISALRAGWDRGHWHSRFGLPDAFHDDVAQAIAKYPPEKTLLRESGPWIQRSLFAIDQGPMLLHLENARSGLIWDLVTRNENIQRAMERMCPACGRYDLNNDGFIDLDDINLVLFNSIFTGATYDPQYDLVPDGVVDIADVFAVAVHFGEVCP